MENSPPDPTSPAGRLSVYATDDPVAASQLLGMLLDLGLHAEMLTRTDVYWGSQAVFFPGAIQLLVPATEAESRRADIDAAIWDLQHLPPAPADSEG
jgi:hypothetical protein